MNVHYDTIAKDKTQTTLQAPNVEHTTVNQQWNNADSTSWRWINVDSMFQFCVPAGSFITLQTDQSL